MFSWNPPWLGVLLLPFGLLPFHQAAAAWLMVNMLLIGVTGIGIWRLFDESDRSLRGWLALPVVFLFPQTITTLDTGQITILVLLGITGFLLAYKRQRWALAGALLTLTTVKPHLVFLWLPFIFLCSLGERHWRVWLGFGSAMIVWLSILTFFLPSWPRAYTAILQAPPTNWATPTLGGFLAVTQGIPWGRYLGLAFLPGTVALWWNTRHSRLECITAGLLTVSLPLAVFGWSYDQILLLIPIVAIAVTLVRRGVSVRDTWITIVLFGIFLIVLFQQRIRSTNELWYCWVPWAVLLIGIWTIHRRKHYRSPNRGARHAIQ